MKLHYLKKALSWLLPYTCILCGEHSSRQQDLCETCYQNLPWLPYSCLCCAIPLSTPEQLCGHCLHHAPPFGKTYSLFLYQAPIAKLIIELKFKQSLVNARVLGELMAIHLQKQYQTQPLPEIIIPVPLHSERLKERGFNQALELARPIARALHLPIHTHTIQRVKATLAQTSLSAEERRQNMKNAFLVTQNLVYNHVAAVDDVITTGNTVTEFCKTLRQSGIQRIDVWCCARAGSII